MSGGALAIIGSAVLEVIGLNLTELEWSGGATWAEQAVFDSEPFFQPTATEAERENIRLATRPHVFGGIDQIELLKSHMRRREVVLFMRLNGFVGTVCGDVAITKMSRTEKKLAPDGRGWRFELTAELLYVGRRASQMGF